MNKQREIKFRYWNGGAMVYEDMPLPDPTWILHNKMYSPYGENILMQYTGLKDKNGKEIYEGDIVKYENEISEVVWGDYDFCFGWYFFTKNQYLWETNGLSNPWDETEVIGNIYKNPELLKSNA